MFPRSILEFNMHASLPSEELLQTIGNDGFYLERAICAQSLAIECTKGAISYLNDVIL
jgi:hypothetical protein